MFPVAFFYRKIHCLTSEFHGKFYAKKAISHELRSDEYDIGFSSEIYFRIHQFGNEFFLNCTSFQRKQVHSQRANGKGKKAISESLSIASE